MRVGLGTIDHRETFDAFLAGEGLLAETDHDPHGEALGRVSTSSSRNEHEAAGRGRDAHYCAPPAQNRTCPIWAYGSHLGCLTAKR